MTESVATTVKQYRYYKSSYSTVKGFFTSALTPAENCSEPLQSRLPVHREPARIRRVPAAVYRATYMYISEWNGNRTHRRPPRIPLPESFNRRVQSFNPFHRIPLSAGMRGLVKKCITKQGFFLTESHEISIAS